MHKYILKKIKLFLRETRLYFFTKVYGKKNNCIPIYSVDFIKDNNINSILILNEGGKTGDTVITTFMFREIKKQYPYIKITVVSKGISKEILEFNPYIDKVYDFDDYGIKKLVKLISNQNYDLLINIREKIKEKELRFIKSCGAKYNVGIDKKGWKLFDISVERGTDYDVKSHLTESFSSILKKIGRFDEVDTSYEIFFDEKREQLAQKLKNEFSNRKVLLINPYGASEYRCLSESTIKKIIKEFDDYIIILLYYGERKSDVMRIGKDIPNVYIPESINGVLDSSVYISVSDVVISPDTSIVHIASAYNKKIISIYTYPKLNNEDIIDHFIYSGCTKDSFFKIFCDVEERRFKTDNHYVNVNDYSENDLKNAIKQIKIEIDERI